MCVQLNSVMHTEPYNYMCVCVHIQSVSNMYHPIEPSQCLFRKPLSTTDVTPGAITPSLDYNI